MSGRSLLEQRAEVLGLECFIGKARLAVPADAVDQVVEYEVSSPLPLARKFVGGLGMVDDRAVLSVSLATRNDAQARRLWTKGVLLRASRAVLRWAIEVSEVGGFVRVAFPPTDRRAGVEHLPPWVRLGRTNDGRSLGWIDALSMVSDLGDDGPRAI
jgi:hypothetical protein